jgi:hypothetical protein
MGLTDRLSPSCSRLGQQHGRRVFPYIALSSFAETVVLRDGIGEIRWQACFSEVPENVARCRRSAAESRVSKAARELIAGFQRKLQMNGIRGRKKVVILYI